MNHQTQVEVKSSPSPPSASRGILQRKCGCGQHTIAGSECEACGKRQVQRRAISQAKYVEQPPTGHQIPDSPSENRTGMPDNLLRGLEQLSGFDLSSVRVRYNSPEPARLAALAYTEGSDIVLAPSQERHLAHEGWHVVQQMQGRVRPTMQMKDKLVNDEHALEHEADEMGSRAQVLGEQAMTTKFQAWLGSGAEGAEDQPYVSPISPVAQRLAVPSPALASSTSNTPVIQRATNFAAGTISETTNLAAHVISGKRDMGFTPPTLNGTTILSGAAAEGAILPPTVTTTAKADGTHDASVTAVATNEASFTMQLPAAPPWSTVTAKANVAALFTSLGLAAQAGCSTAGDSTFSFNGKPSDGDFKANVRTHENIHAADHKIGFNNIMVKWDTKLEAAKTAATVFNGASAADAEAALFKAMGGTPKEIANAQSAEWIRINNITHRGKTLATGGNATPSNSAADPTCATSSMDAT